IHGPIIVGAGPSGLAVAACLREKGIPSVILDRSDCIGSLWRYRTYDRLNLHLPKQFCELPLLGFPAYFPKYPTRDQFVSYLEYYAEQFAVRPEFNRTVLSAHYDGASETWEVTTSEGEYFSRWLIVATGENAEAVVPEIPGIEKFQGRVLHTNVYRSGSEFRHRRVLVVGCGNSGMEVSLDLCLHQAVPHLVVRNSVHVLPREILGISTFAISMALLKWLPLKLVDKLLLLGSNFTIGNTEKLGLRRPKTGPLELKNATGKTPVLDVGALSYIKSGKIKVVAAIKEITKSGAKFVDGNERDFDSIILATGYRSNVPSWLKGSEMFKEDDGMPKAPFPNGWKGKEKGLYAVGFTRRGILGTSSDAVKIARDIGDQWRAINKMNN
ncbi:hypothetical protein M569_11440, partial [Genlisea aurea]